MDALLKIKNLSVSFRTYLGVVAALRDVSFSVYAGETVAIVGESGSGKSVAAQSIMRLIPSPPGKIEAEGIILEKENLLLKSKKEMEAIRGKKVGMIFQDPMTSLNPTMRIGSQITEGLIKHCKLKKGEAKERAVEILNWVGISNPDKRFFQYPHEFSGGMRQRAVIAIALACEPKLLIADEPTTALDVTMQAQILDLMKEIQTAKKTSIILITHDLGIVSGMCDRVLVMYGGKIIEEGPVKKIFSAPFHPYTKGLLKSIPRLGWKKEEKLIPIPGSPPNLLNPPKGCPFFLRCSKAMHICNKMMPAVANIEKGHKVACWLKNKEDLGL